MRGAGCIQRAYRTLAAALQPGAGLLSERRGRCGHSACVCRLLLAGGTLIGELRGLIHETELIFGNVGMQMKPVLKCLGIAAASKFASDLCRDASQTALASALEYTGGLCAAAAALPAVLNVMKMIGGML